MDKIRYLLDSFYVVAYIDGEVGYTFDPSASQCYTLLLDLFTRMKGIIEDMEKNDDGQAWKEARKLLEELK